MQKHENGRRQHENKHDETFLFSVCSFSGGAKVPSQWNLFFKNFMCIHQVEQTSYCHCLTQSNNTFEKMYAFVMRNAQEILCETVSFPSEVLEVGYPR